MQFHKYPNMLSLARRERGLTLKQASELVGLKGVSTLARYESGQRPPPLEKAVQLEILYRTPVAFLFPKAYEVMRRGVRNAEERTNKTRGDLK